MHSCKPGFPHCLFRGNDKHSTVQMSFCILRICRMFPLQGDKHFIEENVLSLLRDMKAHNLALPM